MEIHFGGWGGLVGCDKLATHQVGSRMRPAGERRQAPAHQITGMEPEMSVQAAIWCAGARHNP